MKTIPAKMVKPRTNRRERRPAGMARLLVRGLAASSSASAQRLKAMAQERAATMATRIHVTVRPWGRLWGRSLDASRTAVKANGSAKMECSHLIISRVVRVLTQWVGIAAPTRSVIEGTIEVHGERGIWCFGESILRGSWHEEVGDQSLHCRGGRLFRRKPF